MASGGEMRRHFGRGLQGVGGLHAAQHHVGAGDAGRPRWRRDPYMLLEALRFHVEAVAIDRLDMLRAAEPLRPAR
jgi:hypothetical protein